MRTHGLGQMKVAAGGTQVRGDVGLASVDGGSGALAPGGRWNAHIMEI